MYSLGFGYVFCDDHNYRLLQFRLLLQLTEQQRIGGWGAQGNWDINSLLKIYFKSLFAFLIAVFLFLKTNFPLLSIFGDFDL